VIAIIDARLGRRKLRDANRNDPIAALRIELDDRPYLCEMLERYTKKHGLSVGSMIDIAAASPLPSR
jgi:hypothetical protein